MKNIQIVIRYTKNGINGKDFITFIRGLNLLKYPVEFYVIGDFPEDYPEKYKFVKNWIKSKEEDIQDIIEDLKL